MTHKINDRKLINLMSLLSEISKYLHIKFC